MSCRSGGGGARALDARPPTVLCALVTLVTLLGGCATVPKPAATSVPWEQRLAALQAISHFDLRGRLAASSGSEGFSAGLRWQQQDDQATIDLSAPLGFGAAHIEQTASTLQLTTSKGLTLDSSAAADELRATLGFEPPLASLRFWILGAIDPASGAQPSFDAQQRLARLQQDGWQVDYAEYVLVQQQWLPRGLSVTRGSLRLRVVVDAWHL
jgi:outer membrane lipoprotein LolB